jgi:dinuclear metal center YbgI/SA1388 family protein
VPPRSLADIVSYLDDLLEVTKYEEDEPSNGLMIDAGRPVERIAAAVNTSFATIEGAANAGAQLLLVHHTTWASIDLELKEEKERALREAGVSLYAAHAALDCAPEFGNADSLARLLGVEVAGRFMAWAGGQAGVVGRTEGTFAQLVGRARSALGVPVESWENSETFGRVAIVTGAGYWTRMLDEAHALGCDTYVTGEGAMYTKLYAKEAGINLILGTHYATEAPGIKSLAGLVSEKFDVPWTFVEESPAIL